MKGKTLICKHTGGLEFIDLLDFRLSDNQGNPNARKSRAKHRKSLAKVANKKQKAKHFKRELEEVVNCPFCDSHEIYFDDDCMENCEEQGYICECGYYFCTKCNKTF